ncbi:helix-turn-helix domain-containing protein [Kitasatospora sp. NPDC004669]|uniref:winged helix-turn-helix transcriptional regulator n=1 Tax=Kitasatospora sp. NPDC004669 TaxID=3154555 RepID=UPI0033B6C7E0
MTTEEAARTGIGWHQEREREQGREQGQEQGQELELELDVFAQLCPSREMFAELADKWSLLILMSLAACGPQRFSELQRGVGGVSRKMLTQSLRTLERDGLVRRTVFPETPPRVVYDLLPLGRELAALVSPLGRWTERRARQMLAAREEFDAAHAEA